MGGLILYMSSSKSRTENQYAWSTPPPTAATTALQGMVDQGADYQTPIRNAYARADQNLQHSYANPLGGYTTADVRDKSMRSQQRDLQQSLGMDLSNAAQENKNSQFNRQATVAQLTAPVQNQIGSRQPFTAGDYAGMGLSAASSILS